MKKLLCVLLASTMVLGASPTSVFASESEPSAQIEDIISADVMADGLFEEDKIQVYDSLTEGAAAVGEIKESNSEIIPDSADNCLIVKTDQDIAFDTTHVIEAIRYNGVYYIQYESVQDAEDAISVLEEYPTVEFAEQNETVHIDDEVDFIVGGGSSQDANGYRHYSWGVNAMKADVLADYVSKRVGDQSVTVAVLDTGIDSTHPFLNGKVLNNGYNFAYNNNNPADDHWHGTHVTGIIADCMQGLNVDFLPVKVLAYDGYGMADDIANGIYYAVDQGADVINLSLGGKESLLSQAYIDAAIDDAVANGVIVVAASGNDHKDTAGICPAHRNDIIVTAAIDENYNNYVNSNFGTSVDVTAPGVLVKSCVPFSKDTDGDGYALATGTSMAAPHISAAAAMLRLLHPSMTASQIENEIKSNTTDLGSIGYDTIYGAGLPNLSKFIPYLPFEDISASDWYYEAILDVYTRGYMTGKGNSGDFEPSSNMLREDVALLVYRMAGSPDVAYRTIYPDVDINDYFANAAVWAYDSGVITGNNGKLNTGSYIYRQDFALILYRFADYMGLDTSARGNLSSYADTASISEYAKEAVEWAVGTGIMGQSVEYLSPLGYANRAETAAMINRFLQAYDL